MPGTRPGAVYSDAPWLSSRSMRQAAIMTARPKATQTPAAMKSAWGETFLSSMPTLSGLRDADGIGRHLRLPGVELLPGRVRHGRHRDLLRLGTGSHHHQ